MKHNILVVGILSVIMGVACTESLDIDLNEGENNRLVVAGEITNEPGPYSVRLTRSTSYFYNQPAPAELGATVTISDGEQTLSCSTKTTTALTGPTQQLAAFRAGPTRSTSN